MSSLAERIQLCTGYIRLSVLDINKRHDISLEIPQQLLLLIIKYFVSGTVVIQHHFHRHLYVGSGSTVQYYRRIPARWSMEVHGVNVFKFKNRSSGKYLEITAKGMLQNVDGNGDKFSLFEYDPITKSLASIQCPGCYLAMDIDQNTVLAANKQITLNCNTGKAVFHRFDFEIIYLNRTVNSILIRHSFGGLLRALPGHESPVSGDGVLGQKDESTLWRTEWFENEWILRFISIRTGLWLRMVPRRGRRGKAVNAGGNGGGWTPFQYDPVAKTLESVCYTGWFLAVREGDESVIAVKPESVNRDEDVTLQFELIAAEFGNQSNNSYFC